MKTIVLTDAQYKVLLSFKNYVSMKTREITNKEVLIPAKVMDTLEFEPEYSFGECIVDVIGSVMKEQETGEVVYIT